MTGQDTRNNAAADSAEVQYPEQTGQKFSPAAALPAAALAVACAWAISFVYALADYYCPLVYANILLAAGAGWLVGRCGRALLRFFRIGGERAAGFVGLAGGVAAVWFSWLAYIWVVLEYDFEAYAMFVWPPNLWNAIHFFAENPVWTLTTRGGRSAGGEPAILYYALWLGEAILIAGYAVKECRAFARDNRLCSRCRNWLRSTGDTVLYAVPCDMPEYAEKLSAGDVAFLPSLQRIESADDMEQWLEAECYACGTCEDLNAHVRVTLMQIKPDKNKKPQLEKTVLANLVEMDAATEAAVFSPPAPSGPEPAAETAPAGTADTAD